MLVLTQPFDIPPSFETNQYGIGLWTNIQQGQSYFYCASTLDDYHHPRSSAIFRININEQLSSGWEFVGKVDFPCRNNTISSCGRHFWSVDISPYPRIGLPYQLVPRQLILRKVDPKTLEYEVFQVSEMLDVEGRIELVRPYSTHHFGIILVVYQSIRRENESESGDAFFRLQPDKDRKCALLEQIPLPGISTVQPFCFRRPGDGRKASNIGFIEKGDSLCFYQIDYFGDMFVLEWTGRGASEWIQFRVEGDQFESWMGSEDRDISAHYNDIKVWNVGLNRLYNNFRSYASNGFVYCTSSTAISSGPERTHFYHCDFQIETRVCKCKRIFSSCTEFCGLAEIVIPAENPYNGDQILFLNKSSRIYSENAWEQVVVNRIPTLLQLSYLTACRVTRRKEKTRSEFLLDRLTPVKTTSPSTDKGLSKKRSIFERITQKFRRIEDKQNTPLKISILGVRGRGTGLVPRKKAYVYANQQTSVLPLFIDSQIAKLLNELKNKGF